MIQPFASQYRLAYEAGDPFIQRYLYRYSADEEEDDFATRSKLAYCPAYAKALINEIRTKLASQLHTITRTGPAKILDIYSGTNGGVNGRGLSMTTFIVGELLTELLVQGKAGVLIDYTPNGPVYRVYPIENIHEIKYSQERLVKLKLSRLNGQEYTSYTYTRTGDVVTVHEEGKEKVQVDYPFIPFVIFDIGQSLMSDIWRYQVALLNVEASDIFYIYKSNYPRYTEQRDLRGENPYSKEGETPRKQRHGVLRGRIYGPSLDRPGFIHPSPEPLYASMRKEEQLKEEMARLVDVSLSELGGEGVDSGLATIAAELERGENELANMFAKILFVNEPVRVIYPTVFTLKTDKDRIEEAQTLVNTMATVPSITYRKEVCKQVVRLTLQGKIPQEVLTSIESEIDKLPVIIQDPAKLVEHVEAGILDRVSAALASGYTAEGAVKAMGEKIELMNHIVHSQTNLAARAGGDREIGTTGAKDEKTISQDKALK